MARGRRMPVNATLKPFKRMNSTKFTKLVINPFHEGVDCEYDLIIGDDDDEDQCRVWGRRRTTKANGAPLLLAAIGKPPAEQEQALLQHLMTLPKEEIKGGRKSCRELLVHVPHMGGPHSVRRNGDLHGHTHNISP